MRLVSTRDAAHSATFVEAVRRSVAPGGGLYMPDPLPRWDDVPDLLRAPRMERVGEVLARLVGDEFDAATLRRMVGRALDIAVPLVPAGERTFALELFHGPSLAFKDFGARFLAEVLVTLQEAGIERGPRTILTATSGDTGAAVAHAFLGRPGFRAVVLYPKGLVSPAQERQFGTLGGNVTTLAVDGRFDDCQALVKSCFADAGLVRRHGLTSANSINVARLLAQVVYYVEGVAAARARGVGGELVVAVPSGNFGNLCAGLIAQRLGLPVRRFVAATNVNTTVPEYLETGVYRPRPSQATLSNAMDVGAPNNWERIAWLFGGDLGAMRAALRWGSRDDAGTADALRELLDAGYLADPHGAVAYGVLRQVLEPGETGLFLATAHPAKFAESLERLLGWRVPLPPPLAVAARKPLLSRAIANDRAALVAELERTP